MRYRCYEVTKGKKNSKVGFVIKGSWKIRDEIEFKKMNKEKFFNHIIKSLMSESNEDTYNDPDPPYEVSFPESKIVFSVHDAEFIEFSFGRLCTLTVRKNKIVDLDLNSLVGKVFELRTVDYKH